MHVSQLPSGSWRAIVQHGGQRRSVTARTKREAQRRGAEELTRMGGPPPCDVTVDELLDTHLAESTHLRASTAVEYRTVRRLLPVSFASRTVATVTPPVIDVLYRDLEARDISSFRMRKLHSLLSGAFRRAVRRGLVAVNPCREALLPPEPGRDDTTPTSEQARLLLAACDAIAPAFGLFVAVAASTGARRSQILGLQRGDVDLEKLEKYEISYRRGVTMASGSGMVIAEPKSGRRERRTVAIGPDVAARLKAHLLAQDVEALTLGEHRGPTAWVFTEDGRAPWYPSTPTHWWAKARDAAGIETVRLHDLRHYVATELFAGGFDEQTTMRRLGHSNPVITGKRYATARPARDRAAAEWIERGLGA